MKDLGCYDYMGLEFAKVLYVSRQLRDIGISQVGVLLEELHPFLEELASPMLNVSLVLRKRDCSVA